MENGRPPKNPLPDPVGMPGDSAGISRRDFARLTLGAAAAATLPAGLLIEPKPSAAQSLPKEAMLSPAAEEEAKLKAETLLAKYGSRLSDLQKNELRDLVHGTQEQLERLRAYKLDNGDDPALVFEPYRREGA